MARPRFSEEEARNAIAESCCWAESLRRLGMRAAGGNHKTIQKWAARWGISTDHFDPALCRASATRQRAKPLADVLVPNSRYNRGQLKQRLYREGLKERRCERCGQDELWLGRRMSLILDHVNGDAYDNRLDNLQIVCPNCAATLDTHCGRNLDRVRSCLACGVDFAPQLARHVYCSLKCAGQSPNRKQPRPHLRRVERPPYEQLMRAIADTSYLAVGRKYGVSDNAIRKWVRAYERAARIS